MAKATHISQQSTAQGTRSGLPDALLAFSLTASALLASAATEASTPYSHDDLHVRFGIGVVAGWTLSEKEGNKTTFSGPGLLDGVQIGGHPIENVTIFFEADTFTLLPTSMSNPSAVQDATHKPDTGSYTFLTGAGAGYYLTPANIYVSGAIGASFNNLNISEDAIDFNRVDRGIGFSIMLAKEWWVSEQWSAGIVGQFLHTAAIDKRDIYSPRAVAGGLLFSVSHS